MEQLESRWSPRLKLIVGLLSLGFIIYLIATFRGILPAVILAGIVAYILSPLVDFLTEKARFPEWAAITVVYLLAILVLLTVSLVFYRPLSQQAVLLYEGIQILLSQAEELFSYQITIAGQTIQGSMLFERVTGLIQEVSQPVFGHTLGFAVEVISSLVELSFTFVISIYLLKDGKEISKSIEGFVPTKYRQDFIYLKSEISKIWSAFFRGQLLLSLVSASIFTSVGLIIGMPFALPMGVLAGLMEFSPHIGHGIWSITAGLIALLSGSTWINIPNWIFALIVLALQFVFIQFDYNYLIPRMVGKRVQLSPLVIILGILAGASLAGVLGVVLASPIIASARVLLRYIYFNIFEEELGLEKTTSDLPPPDPRWWQLQSPQSKDQPSESQSEP
ncbi:MAG: putative transport protein [Chloroflexi bacterium]|nr:putative transport protein [Chloroflexota bacterium]